MSRSKLSLEETGDRLHEFAEELYPICRSITGDGVRRTLAAIGERIPVEVSEVPSGTPVFDWTVPDEWNIRDAYVADGEGRRVVDFRSSNLHVVSYSEPVDKIVTLAELRPHLHTLPEHPEWIPYRTSYYERTWGFCLAQRVLDELPDGAYRAVVDSTLEPGSLTYGECVLPGESDVELLLTAHICHPSLANDNLSGIAVLTELAARLAEMRRRLSYRILFIPGTIGSLTWLARNESILDRIAGGLVITCVGDPGRLAYKRSRAGNAPIDRAASHVVQGAGGTITDFVPYGYDERQFNSPGFAIPAGALTRSSWGQYPEYHTSADDLGLVRPDALADSLRACLDIIDVLERNRTYLNLQPKGEPQLGKYGLYPKLGGPEARTAQLAMLWVLNQSDGEHSLLEVADRSGLPFRVVAEAASKLESAGLLEPAPVDA